MKKKKRFPQKNRKQDPMKEGWKDWLIYKQDE
jgi:hypothetical protein